jgi:hypothetical protein
MMNTATPSDATPPILDQVNSLVAQYFSRIAFAVLFLLHPSHYVSM